MEKRGQIGLQHHHYPGPDTTADSYCLSVQGSGFFFALFTNRKSPDLSRVVSEEFEKKKTPVHKARSDGKTYIQFNRVYTIRFEKTYRNPGGLPRRGAGRLPGGTVSAKAPYGPATVAAVINFTLNCHV